MQPVVGVLALQGAFARHRPHIEAAGGIYKEITESSHLEECQSLIMPGGESSSMIHMIKHKNLAAGLEEFVGTRSVWGICAGAILLANQVLPEQFSLKAMDFTAHRNGYGSQIYSEQVLLDGYEVSFIRAPVFELNTQLNAQQAQEVTVQHRYKGQPVALSQGRLSVTSFHPELSQEFPSPWHVAFVEQCKSSMEIP